jgi:hypothetical protein
LNLDRLALRSEPPQTSIATDDVAIVQVDPSATGFTVVDLLDCRM